MGVVAVPSLSAPLTLLYCVWPLPAFRRLTALVAAQWEAMEQCMLMPEAAETLEVPSNILARDVAWLAGAATPSLLTLQPQLLERLTAAILHAVRRNASPRRLPE